MSQPMSSNTFTPDDVRRELARLLDVPPEEIADDRPLVDLSLDSIRLVELVVELQEVTGARLRQEDLRGATTVGTLTRAIVARIPGQDSGRAAPR